MLVRLLTLAAAATQVPQPPPATPPDAVAQAEVVVTGRRAQALDAFVAALTQHRAGRQIARWNRRICVRTLGLDSVHDAFVLREIGRRVGETGVAVIGPRCAADVLLVFTGDPDGFARLLVRRYPRLFQDDDLGAPGVRRLRENLLNGRPVRWIGASRTMSAAGVPLAGRANMIYSASRLTESTREDAAMALAIVDTRAMSGVNWAQLVGYLTMVAMASPAPDAAFGDGSILSLFRLRDAGERPPADLTDDDRAFLGAFYATTASATASRQRGDIRRAMERAEQAGKSAGAAPTP